MNELITQPLDLRVENSGLTYKPVKPEKGRAFTRAEYE
jgi:hypothetical protein